MTIKQISSQWYRLDSESDEGRLTWFGRSTKEVKYKFEKWIREQDLKKLRS